MGTQGTNNGNEERNNTPDAGQAASSDERESANNGDWEGQRDDTRTYQEDYDSDQNDNTGGAGSTGSAATNS